MYLNNSVKCDSIVESFVGKGGKVVASLWSVLVV